MFAIKDNHIFFQWKSSYESSNSYWAFVLPHIIHFLILTLVRVPIPWVIYLFMWKFVSHINFQMRSCLHHLEPLFCNPTIMNALWQVWAMSRLTYQPPLNSREAEQTSSFTLSSDIQSSGFLDHTCPLSHQQTPHHKQYSSRSHTNSKS